MAKFYVNRGGGRVPEGPFEEQQVVKLILAGRLRAGHVSAVGSQRFFPIASHPPFALALAQAGAPADPAAAPGVTFETKPASRGLLLGALLAILGLGLCAVAIGSYVMFSNGGMPVRGALPGDTELLVEVRSVPQLFKDLRALRVVDAARFTTPHFFDDAAQALTDCFGAPKAQTQALLLAATALGVAARKLEAEPESGVLLTFSNATPVNAFLSSRRFHYVGLVAKSGRKYSLSAATPPPSANVDHARRALIALSLDADGAGIVWFETRKVLFVGSPRFAESIARVLSLDVPSLEQAQSFQTAQQALAGNPNISGYFSGSKLAPSSDPALQAWVAGSFGGAGPISASVDLVPAGLLSHFVGHAANAAADGGAPLGKAPPLSLMDRLPVESFGYVAATTRGLGSGGVNSGAALQQRLFDRLSAANAPLAGQVSALLAQAEARLRLKPADLLASIGDEAAVALLARPDYSLTLAEPSQMIGDFALVYLQAFKDDAPARAACQALQAELSAVPGQFSVAQQADGYQVTSKDGSLRAQVRFSNGYLFLALGGTQLVERSLRAFSVGENTIAADPAQRAARGVLPSTGQLVAWLDVGRIIDATQKNPLLAVPAWRVGFDALHALKWTGPERVTAGLAISSEQHAGTTTYRIDGLNLPLAAGAYGLLAP